MGGTGIAGFFVTLQVKNAEFRIRMSQDKQNPIIEETAADAAQQQTGASDFGGYDRLVTVSPREHIRRRTGMYIGQRRHGSPTDAAMSALI